ncbi:MAG: amino acid ABC transporter ATP-binding protein [Burkholderiaceae bacterium]
MIEVSNVVKSFGSLDVLKGVSFEVAQGEVAVIIGASGSGKSTILRCINFLDDFQGGTIKVNGESVGYDLKPDATRVPQSERTIAKHRQKVGMVFQSFNLFPHKTVVENVMTGPIRAKGMARAEGRSIAESLLAKVGLSDKLNELPANLSGGQQQRVAIARALAMQPNVMLFDEVTSALDPELVGEVLKVIRELALDGMTMILVTHEIHFARDVGDKLLFIDSGTILEQGQPKGVLDNPESDRLKAFLTRFSRTNYL